LLNPGTETTLRKMQQSELRTEMPIERLRQIISTMCKRWNLRW